MSLLNLQLTPGWTAFIGPQNLMTLRAPGGGFVDVPSAGDPSPWLDRLDNVETSFQPLELDRTTAALLESGVVANVRDDVGNVPDLPIVWLVGASQPLTAALSLVGSFRVVSSPVTAVYDLLDDSSAPEIPPHMVCWMSDGPPPNEWLSVGDRLPERGIGWIRCSREGDLLYVEPPAWQHGDPRHVDVRLRRLSASAAPSHLSHYWAASRRVGCSELTGAASLFIAGLLATVMAGRQIEIPPAATGRGDGPSPSIGPVLLVADLRTGLVESHTVLPLPSGRGVPTLVGFS